MNSKLSNLRNFLLGERLYKEACHIGISIMLLKKDASLEDTVLLLPQSRPWKSRSEEELRKAELTPIRFIAGTEANKRGEGEQSAEGNVYEVLYKGKVAVAKVIQGVSPAEPEVWRKISSIKDKLPEEEARHLPIIYDIIKTNDYTTIIIMELLSAPNPYIRNILRTREGRQVEDVMKDDSFISDALKKAFEEVYQHKPEKENKNDSEIYAFIESQIDSFRVIIEGSLMKREMKPDQLSEKIQSFVANYANNFNLDSSLSKIISDSIEDKFMSFLNVSPKPIPKYYSPGGIDYTLEMLDGGAYGAEPSVERQKKMDALKKEREEAVYNENPSGFAFSENYMPETKTFFSMLNSLKDLGIEWSDVHARNIMERPGSNELVLIDVGLFD